MNRAAAPVPDRFVRIIPGPRTLRGAFTCGAPLRRRVVRSIKDCI